MSNFKRNEMLEVFEMARRLYIGGLPVAVARNYARRICILTERHTGQLTAQPADTWTKVRDSRGLVFFDDNG